MSRKLFNHFVRSNYIDVYKEIRVEESKDLCSLWWVKYQERKNKQNETTTNDRYEKNDHYKIENFPSTQSRNKTVLQGFGKDHE